MKKMIEPSIRKFLMLSGIVCVITTLAGMPWADAKAEAAAAEKQQSKNTEADMWANPLWNSEESLENWVPFQEMAKLQKDVNQLFRNSMREVERATGPMSQGVFSVRTDVRELPD